MSKTYKITDGNATETTATKITITTEESAAMRRWYGDDAQKMEALFASATPEAYDEAVSLSEPTFPPGDSKAAARRAAWAIINRARDAREACKL